MPGEVFKNKIRIRVNGILQYDHSILLVQLQSPVTEELVWMPPGGGLEFGESLADCLQREFREETGLQIRVGSLAFVNEMIKPPFHAIEFYISVHEAGGDVRLGTDPELPEDAQLLKDLRWVSAEELRDLNVVPDQLIPWIEGSGQDNMIDIF